MFPFPIIGTRSLYAPRTFLGPETLDASLNVDARNADPYIYPAFAGKIADIEITNGFRPADRPTPTVRNQGDNGATTVRNVRVTAGAPAALWAAPTVPTGTQPQPVTPRVTIPPGPPAA